MSTKLFKPKTDADCRKIRYTILMNQDEHKAISHAANIRKLSIGEYCRRAALGRRADIRYEMDIVLQLSKIVKTIRGMHVDLVERGIEPTAEGFRPVIDEAIAAMLRIEY